jgi:hypothetical protein
MEFVARRTLQQQQTSARLDSSLYSPRKTTACPTAERLRLTLIHIKLIIVYLQESIEYQIEGFSHVHRHILEVLGLSPDLYTSLNRTIRQVPQAIPAA